MEIKGPGGLSFLDDCPKYFFFQLPKLTNIVWGLPAQNGSPVGLHAAHSMPQRIQNVIKNEKGMPVTEILNRFTR